MSGVLAIPQPTISASAARFADASMAANTRAAYTSDWANFSSWCTVAGQVPMPADPATVANYLAAQADRYSAATIDRRLAAVNKAHLLHGYPAPGDHPAVKTVLAGIRRTIGRKPRRMRPILIDDLQAAVKTVDVQHWPSVVAGRRDQCLLVFGFAGAFRRSELAPLKVGDCIWQASDGLHVTVSRSKTDQEGVGQVKALPYGRNPDTCPACVLNRWLDLLAGDPIAQLDAVQHPAEGHVCRAQHPAMESLADMWLFPPVGPNGSIEHGRHITGQAINDVVQRRLAAAGIGPAGYGAHSMRAGFVTQALRSGATDAQVMRQTGHRSPATVHVYDRENNPLRGNAVTRIGL